MLHSDSHHNADFSTSLWPGIPAHAEPSETPCLIGMESFRLDMSPGA